MIDLHTHTLLSDGVLLPSELIRRAEVKGYRAIAITDHVDASNIECVTEAILRISKDAASDFKIKVIPGVEITHVPLPKIIKAVKFVRSKGIKLVVLHGETMVEPVLQGTNRAGIAAGVDIIAHPGLLSLEDAKLAAAKGVHLEITSRGGHSLSNGHVAKIAALTGAKLVINSDSHRPDDLIDKDLALRVLSGAGLNPKEAQEAFGNSKRLACRALDITKLM